MKRERQPREKREFKKEGTFKKRPRIDYDKDYSYIKDHVYGILNSRYFGDYNPEEYKWLDGVINDLNTVDTNRNPLNYPMERLAIRFFAKRWIEENVGEHGDKITSEVLLDFTKFLAKHIEDNTKYFTNDIVRSQSFGFIHTSIIPRLFVMSEVNDEHVDKSKWMKLRSLTINMMINGNDRQFKERVNELVKDINQSLGVTDGDRKFIDDHISVLLKK